MVAKQFNDLVSNYAQEKLVPLGFKKKGAHYYLHQGSKVVVFFRRTTKNVFFEGFYLALTHDFLSNTISPKGKFALPPYLEDYPVSIAAEILPEEYKKHKTAFNFSYDLNFTSREVLPSRKYSKKYKTDFIAYQILLDDDAKTEKYISSSIDILLEYGMKFFEEFSPQLSYLSITKYPDIDKWDIRQIKKFKTELLDYMNTTGLELPVRKSSWWKRMKNFS